LNIRLFAASLPILFGKVHALICLDMIVLLLKLFAIIGQDLTACQNKFAMYLL
jgi:hypothetical protein